MFFDRVLNVDRFDWWVVWLFVYFLDGVGVGGVGDRSWKMGCFSSKMCFYFLCVVIRVISICLQCFFGRMLGIKVEVVWNEREMF